MITTEENRLRLQKQVRQVPHLAIHDTLKLMGGVAKVNNIAHFLKISPDDVVFWACKRPEFFRFQDGQNTLVDAW